MIRMRTRKHYETMLENNPDTTWGLSLATKAVYAAKHGIFDHNASAYIHDEYRAIYLRLQKKYGEALNPDDVRNEMNLIVAMSYMGSQKSDAKAKAARENGKKGGRPRNPEMKYDLINDDGCLMATTRATSFTSARAYFADYYTGRYVILCAEIDDRRNVILK